MEGVRYVFTRRCPDITRVLLVESGPRFVLEKLLPALDRNHPGITQLDILTCHPGAPRGFDPARGRLFHVQDFQGASKRRELFAQLKRRQPDVCGLLCTGASIMTAWKWLTAWHSRSKIFLVNENADYFWLDRGHVRILWRFALTRAGLGGGHTLAHLGQILLFPFTLAFLLVYAAQVHLRRKLRAS
jgi:hypothetical protein